MLRRVAVDLGVAIIALSLGFGGWAVMHRHHSGVQMLKYGIVGDPSPGGPAIAFDPSKVPAIATATVAPLPGSGAADARTATDRYLAAQQAGDTVASYLLLSDEDRHRYPSPARWVQAQAAQPRILEYTLGPPAADGTVAGTVALQPTLDEITGDVPGHATAAWVTVQEHGAYYVALAASTLTAQWPSAAGAAPAVQAWATARQQCTTADEFASLVGTPSLADKLCRAKGTVTVGSPERLAPADATAVTAAFGGSASDWARVVSVTGPTSLRAVVAPKGDDWIVVGVLTPPP